MKDFMSRSVTRSVTSVWDGSQRADIADPEHRHEVIVQRVEYRMQGSDHGIDGGRSTIVRPVISITFVVGRGVDEKAQTVEVTREQLAVMRTLLDIVVGSS